MCDVIYSDQKKRKKYIKNWLESRSEYQSKKNIYKVFTGISLFILAIFISIPFFIMDWAESTEDLIEYFIGIYGTGLIFAFIPYCIGAGIKNKAFHEYGTPYVDEEHDCLKVYDDGIEHLYHYSPDKSPESMNVYRIPMENINAVLYDEQFHILTIIGEGELLSYDDYENKRLNYQNSQRKFYSNSPYSIVMAFEDELNIVQKIKNMAKYN